jgi:DNA-binding transcriptional MerR regulator
MRQMSQPMMIGEAAMVLGMTRPGVRALERRGWLTSVRSVGGWRIYLSDEVEALRKLRAKRASHRQPIGGKR